MPLPSVLWIGVAAALLGPGPALACVPDALGNSGSGGYFAQSSGVLEAVRAQAAHPFSVGTLSIYVQQVSGTAQMDAALYSDAAGLPGSLLAQSSSGPQAAVAGWVSFSIPALALPAGAYWLAFQASNGNVQFRMDLNGSPTVNTTQNNPYGSFPATWTGTAGLNQFLWCGYIQICSDLSTATPTVSASPTPTRSSTPTTSPSPSPSATGTATLMPTASPSVSVSPSHTATPTPAATATPAPSFTPACANGPVWPNPFTPSLGANAQAQFCAPPGHPAGTLRIYSLKRRLLRTVQFGAGQPVAWDGKDGEGNPVLFGIYPYQLQCNGQVFRGAVTVMR